MPNITAMAAKMNREVAAGLARHFQAMSPEKQTWQPLDAGRCALDQIQECAGINLWTAQMLRDRAMPPIGENWMQQLKTQYDTPEKALAGLQTGTDALIAAIEAFPAEHLDDTLQLPWDSAPSSLAEIMMLAYWNMAYHLGQISYIQTLYGDRENH
ncbi:MAG TPA: hypothetical protein VKT32_17105 [Chthonomonadaceae bacterium]|nr:hypothetical protein [Chthonomonadaceae bacterium]